MSHQFLGVQFGAIRWPFRSPKSDEERTPFSFDDTVKGKAFEDQEEAPSEDHGEYVARVMHNAELGWDGVYKPLPPTKKKP